MDPFTQSWNYLKETGLEKMATSQKKTFFLPLAFVWSMDWIIILWISWYIHYLLREYLYQTYTERNKVQLSLIFLVFYPPHSSFFWVSSQLSTKIILIIFLGTLYIPEPIIKKQDDNSPYSTPSTANIRLVRTVHICRTLCTAVYTGVLRLTVNLVRKMFKRLKAAHVIFKWRYLVYKTNTLTVF